MAGTPSSAALAGFTGLNANTEIVITRNGVVVAELDNIEEITINTLNVSQNDGGGTDTPMAHLAVFGNFNPTSLRLNTITIEGDAGDDTIDISSLGSAHRIVFRSNGGNDTDHRHLAGAGRDRAAGRRGGCGLRDDDRERRDDHDRPRRPHDHLHGGGRARRHKSVVGGRGTRLPPRMIDDAACGHADCADHPGSRRGQDGNRAGRYPRRDR